MIRITMSDKAKKLEPLLRKLYDDDDYVQGVIINAGTEENIDTIIRFINYANEHMENITADDIAKLALYLDGRVTE